MLFITHQFVMEENLIGRDMMSEHIGVLVSYAVMFSMLIIFRYIMI